MPPARPNHLFLNEKWRAKHETDYRRDWVTIAGLHPLKQGVNTAGSAASNDIVLPASTPGRWVGSFETIRQFASSRWQTRRSPSMVSR